MQESIQDSSKVGNALKTISANMSGVVASAKTGEVQMNKTAKVLKEMAGIDVWNEQTGEVKDMYTVMGELNGVWGDLNESQRSAIAQTIAGKTQLNTFFALMSNWEQASKYVKEYKEGLMVGSAEAEQARYLDSIQGKWASLKANLQGIANNLISSDFAKGLLDVFTAIAGVIEKITSNGFGSFAVGLAGIAGTVKMLLGLFNKFKSAGNIVDILTGGGSIGKTAAEVTKASGAFSKLGTKVSTAMKTVGTSMSAGVKSLGLFSSAGATATTLVSAAFLALPYAIAGYVKYQEYANEKQIKQSKETIKALEEQIATNEQASASAKQIATEYDKLSNTTNKTAEEQARYAELTKQVAEIFPNLVKGYDDAGNPILDLNGSLETYIRNLDKAIDRQKELTASEQSKLADEQKEYLDRIEKYREQLDEANRRSTLDDTSYSDIFDGEIDADKLKNVLKEREDAERESYEKSLEYYEQAQQSKLDIMKDYQNEFQDSFGYTKASEEEQKRLNDMFNNLDLGKLNYEGGDVDAFLKDLTNLNDKLVQTTSEMGESEKAINKAEDAFGNTMNLKNYTDALTEAYEATGKIDNESFGQWVDGVRQYAETTGDLEGANAQAMKMCETLEELTGIDAKTWFDGLDFDFAPVEEGTKKLNEFMQAYGTGVQNIGKGGMADKLNREFEQLRDLPMDLADELSQNGEISAEFLINATAEMVTPVKELVDKIVANGEVTDEEIKVLLDVQSEIENEGEISEETKAKIKKLFPEMTDEEIEQRFTIKADIENEQAIDKILKDRDELSTNVESAIQVNVENAEQAEMLYDTLQQVPEEKRIEVANNFGEVQQICRELGMNIDDIPTEVIADIIMNGGTEALGQCEDLKSAVEFLNETYNLDLKVTGDGEVIGDIKGDLDGLPDEVDIDVNVDTDDANGNLEETKSTLDSVQSPNPINITANTSDADSKINNTKSTLDTVQSPNPINITANNSDAISKASSAQSTINSVKQTSPAQINANASGATTAANTANTAIDNVKQNSPAQINADASNAISGANSASDAISNVKSKSISITASVGGALTAIGSVISKLAQLGNRSVSVTASVNYINNPIKTPNGTMSADAFGTFGYDDSFNVMADYNPTGDFSTYASMGIPTPVTLSSPPMMSVPGFEIDSYTELKNRIDAVNDSLKLLSTRAERAHGKEKIAMIRQQIELYKQQQELQIKLGENLKKQQQELKRDLQHKGIKFTDDGNIKDYEATLESMEATLENYEKAYEKAQEAEKNYKGKDDKKKDQLSDATDKAREKVDDYKEKLDEVKDLMDEYLELTYDGIPDARQAWEDLENQIRDAEEEIKQIENDMREFALEKWKLSLELDIEEADRALTKIENKIDLLDAKMEHASGKTLLGLEEEKIKLINEQMDEYLNKQKVLKSTASAYKEKLSEYGITFNGNEMANYEEVLKRLHAQESDMYDEVTELAEEYLDIIDNQIPEAELAWYELNNELKDIAEERLERAADIEKELTDIYKKELDKQVEAMEKATDKRIDALKKEKDAYNAMRDEADYKDDLLDQQDKINDLNKQIELAKRDTSINGQQRLRELIKELEEEQENFQELTQDHLDEQVNDLYDSEMDRIQEQSDKSIEKLEEEWSDERIAKAVAESLSKGVFVGLDGTVSNLKDKLLETTVESGEAFSVLGEKIQSELCDNLQIALDTMQNLAGIYNELDGISDMPSFYVPTQPSKSTEKQMHITNSPVFNVENNGSDLDYDKIELLIKKSSIQIIDQITKY